MFDSRQRLIFGLLLLMLPIFFGVDILLGNVSISFDKVLAILLGEPAEETYRIIVMQSRIPKAITALLCGSSLAVSGLLMQTLFRNPLAGPYILGISSGSGLGVAILIMGSGILGFSYVSNLSISIAAIIGAIAILLILFIISTKVRDVMTLLILGVMIGAISTAIIGIIQYFTSDYQLKSFLIWSLGSLSGTSFNQLLYISLVVFVGTLTAFFFSKNFNALSMGEEYAKTIGFSIIFVRFVVILISGLLTGVITAYCGPIGFIGIVVPHLARLIFKSANHFILIPGSILIGMIMLLLSDILTNIYGRGISLPINSITAILGIPIIIWIIFSKRKISSGF